MIEFGERLRKAREAKGITQQTLAERIYVTRQTVSRWERGDRYPDLITLKKLSSILDVSTDELLTDDELPKIAERTPVTQRSTAKNCVLALYAAVASAFVVSGISALMRIDRVFPLDSAPQVIELAFLAAQTVLFALGLLQTLRDALTPKRAGAVIAAYFGLRCLRGAAMLFASIGSSPLLRAALILPDCIGCVGAYAFFICGKREKLSATAVIAASAWGTLRALYGCVAALCFARPFVSADTALNLLQSVCAFALFLIQTAMVCRRRKFFQ